MKDLFLNVYEIDGRREHGAAKLTREDAKAVARFWSDNAGLHLRPLYLIRVKPRDRNGKYESMSRRASCTGNLG